MSASQPVLEARQAYQNGDWAAAERLCHAALEMDSGDFDALNLLGIIAAQSSRLQEAVKLLTKATDRNPAHAGAQLNLGNALHLLGRFEDALARYGRALRIDPQNVRAHAAQGDLLLDMNRPGEALQAYGHAARIDASDAQLHYKRSIALGTLNQYDQARQACDAALAIKPDLVEALNNRGNALMGLGCSLDAIKDFERALEINPAYSDAWSNRGIALRNLGKLRAALNSYERALERNPRHTDTLYNKGIVLAELGRPTEAMVCYQEVLGIQPDRIGARWNLGLCQLQMGDFEQGWAAYESRWEEPQLAAGKRVYPQPLWLGDQPLHDKTILLHAEAGLGDTLQFCRYVGMVAELGARVVLEVQPELEKLLAGLHGMSQIVARNSPLPPFDFHCPLMSLPLALRTRLSSIPAHVPYIRADDARRSGWECILGPRSKPRVGLVWSGNPKHRNDHNRSMAFNDLMPLLDDGIEWVSLQKDVRDADKAALNARTDIRDFSDSLIDFSDTAALIDHMDLVISVDTSVAHLAGAMGKPVWILLPFVAEWRWLINRNDSPWYPTARLFRQGAIGQWANVMDEVSRELRQRFLLSNGTSAEASGGAPFGGQVSDHVSSVSHIPADANKPDSVSPQSVRAKLPLQSIGIVVVAAIVALFVWKFFL